MSADHLQSFFSCLEPIHPDIDTNQFLNDIRQSTFDSQFYNNHADVDSYLSPKSPELDASSISSGSDEFNTSSGSLSLSPTSNIVSMLNSNVHYLHSQHQPLPQSSVTSMTTDASPMHLGLGLSELKTPTPAPAAVLSYGLPLNGNLMVCAPSPVSSVGSSPDSNGISAGMNGIKLKVEMPSPLATPMPAGMPPPPPMPNGLSTPASTSGSSSGVPVDTDTIRELLKEQGVKRQRLARKAELARLSRKRKKTRLGELEGEVAILKEELERERKSRKAAEDSLIVAQQQARISQALAAEADQSAVFSEIAVAEESKQLHDAIRRGFASNAPPQEIARLASEVVNVVKKRQNNVAHQMKQVQKHVTPSLPLRFLEWALNQKDQFYEDNSGLWNSLFVREVGLSPEQLQAIMSLRQNMQLQRNSGLEVQSAYAKLIAAFQTQASQTTASLDKFVSLLSHEQLAKFFAWVDTYGSVCVQINI